MEFEDARPGGRHDAAEVEGHLGAAHVFQQLHGSVFYQCAEDSSHSFYFVEAKPHIDASVVVAIDVKN